MPFYNERPDGLTVNIRLTPQAQRNAITGLMDTADGNGAIKISINAVPEDGKANKALIAFLAKAWKLPKSAFSLISGQTSRFKAILIAGNTQDLLSHLRQQNPDLFQ